MTARWKVTTTHRIDDGFIEDDHEITEIVELAQIIERGPHWDTLEKIEIVRINVEHPKLTIEQAAKL